MSARRLGATIFGAFVGAAIGGAFMDLRGALVLGVIGAIVGASGGKASG